MNRIRLSGKPQVKLVRSQQVSAWGFKKSKQTPFIQAHSLFVPWSIWGKLEQVRTTRVWRGPGELQYLLAGLATVLGEGSQMLHDLGSLSKFENISHIFPARPPISWAVSCSKSIQHHANRHPNASDTLISHSGEKERLPEQCHVRSPKEKIKVTEIQNVISFTDKLNTVKWNL